MRILLLILLVSFTGIFLKAQTKLDSLYVLWQNQTQPDSVRVNAYKAYIWDGFLYSDPDSALVLIEDMSNFGEKHNYPKAINQANTLKGIAWHIKGDFTSAMDYYLVSLKGSEEIGDARGISETQICIGVVYDDQGDYPRALEHYNKALAIDEQIGNKGGMAMSLNNIGNIYLLQNDYERALDSYKQALAMDEALGVKQGVATELSNIGGIYRVMGKSTLALEYYERALAIHEEIQDMEGVANNLINTADLNAMQGHTDRAFGYFERALDVYKALGSQQGISKAHRNLGDYHLRQNEVPLALDHCLEALQRAKEIESPELQKSAHDCLYMTYKANGNSSRALVHLEQTVVLKDSIFNEENTKKLTRLHMQYQFDKKEAATQAAQEKKDAIAAQELKQQKLVRNGFIGGFTVMLLFAGVFLVQRNKIGKEKQRSEALLLNILPEETALELKEKGSSDAVLIDQVTVLFTDFKGFTAMSEQLSPKNLVKDLHECFSLFDHICEKYGIEKIKTIGDAYMAAGGLPSPNSTHPQDVVKAALEMAEVVERGKTHKIEQGLPFFEVRIGVHTGPVVAGIVGVKKFQYDIWGDTVNTAARMESSGVVGKVNISESTYELLKDQFTCEYRGEVEAKGKGRMKMYFVLKA